MTDGPVVKWAVQQLGFDSTEQMWKAPKWSDDGTVGEMVFERMKTLVLTLDQRESSRQQALAQMVQATSYAIDVCAKGGRLTGGLTQAAGRVDEANANVQAVVDEIERWIGVWKNCGGPVAG